MLFNYTEISTTSTNQYSLDFYDVYLDEGLGVLDDLSEFSLFQALLDYKANGLSNPYTRNSFEGFGILKGNNPDVVDFRVESRFYGVL